MKLNMKKMILLSGMLLMTGQNQSNACAICAVRSVLKNGTVIGITYFLFKDDFKKPDLKKEEKNS